MSAAQRPMPIFGGTITVAEFEAIPNPPDGTRYELVDGELRLQHAASDTHGTIQANLSYLIGTHLRTRNGPCRVVNAPGIAVRMNANHNKRIPDLGVTCDPNHRGGQDMPSPKALIEILSPSNKVETLTNVWAFTTIPSLQEVLIVSSFERAVFRLARAGDQSWPEAFAAIEDSQAVQLSSIGFSCALGDIYYQTYLSDA